MLTIFYDDGKALKEAAVNWTKRAWFSDWLFCFLALKDIRVLFPSLEGFHFFIVISAILASFNTQHF